MRVPFSKRVAFIASAVSIALFLLAVYFFKQPRVLAVNEVPLAFWAWRTNAPGETDVRKAFAATDAKALFLRAGQMDFENGTLQRIRPVSGALPAIVDLHLVYNATRTFLRQLETLEPKTIAETIARTYQSDLLRASQDQAQTIGLQLDFDVPSRLLPRYAEIIAALRALLPPNTTLSITGLPTWAYTKEIKDVLAGVDFWIPQCYGMKFPDHLTKEIPISSPQEVAQTISRIRQLDKPFYAGLSAYSYAILYAKDGALVELRGDLDPAWAANNSDLELVESRDFSAPSSHASEKRYVYRATSDVVLDGLIIRAGEWLVFDLPSAETLRASARAVRENAGENLLGICVFRLPVAKDETVLSLGEMVAALSDQDCLAKTELSAKAVGSKNLQLRLENRGTANASLGEDALTIEMKIPPGGLKDPPKTDGIASYETLCRFPGADLSLPCSQRRASELRFVARSWKPESKAVIQLRCNEICPKQIAVTVTTRVNDGRIVKEELTALIQNHGE